MLPNAVVLIVACAALAVAQHGSRSRRSVPRGARSLRALRPLCSGHAQDRLPHKFTSQEEDHCPSPERFKAYEREIENAECKPRTVMVELRTDDEHTFHPAVVEAQRCGGHCDEGRCVAAATKTRALQVTRTNAVAQTTTCGLVEVEDHTECGCKCEVRAEDCNKWQYYDETMCRCKCTERRRCESGQWDEHACHCACPRRECDPGEEWVAHQCRCVQFVQDE